MHGRIKGVSPKKRSRAEESVVDSDVVKNKLGNQMPLFHIKLWQLV
jgi:hypothetical protein